MHLTLALAALCLVLVAPRADGKGLGENSQGNLMDHLFNDYDRGAQPARKVELVLVLVPVCLTYDEGRLTSIVWEHHQWKDSRLSWNPEEFDGITELRLLGSRIWTPDTIHYNSLVAIEKRFTDIHALVKSDGTVDWIPRAEYESYCNPGTEPITCLISVGSYIYNVDKLAIADGKPTILKHYLPECPYVIVDHTEAVVPVSCVREDVYNLQVTFTIKEAEEKE